MSFLIPCPNCGPREFDEFRFGGEFNQRPSPEAEEDTWRHFVYDRDNVAGPQTEWWYHRFGCREWFLAIRDTRTNVVERSYQPGEDALGRDD